jgi:hypothetical protein
MTQAPLRFLVILDSNVWVTERLLQTTLGTALLFAITKGDGAIGLPEVVELEVGSVLMGQADQAVEAVRKNTQLLRQLSGRKVSQYVPTRSAIQAGIMERWTALSGVLRRTKFTHEQAKAALARVIAKLPPSGENNEQFRDACIWAAAVESAKESPVHLITNDRAFFEGRDLNRAILAKVLQREIKEHTADIIIYPTIAAFLDDAAETVTKIDEELITTALLDSIKSTAFAIAAEDAADFGVAGSSVPRIRGYATPKPSTIAISFDCEFELVRVIRSWQHAAPKMLDLWISGDCSYDPKSHLVSEINIKHRSLSVKGGRSQRDTYWTDREVLEIGSPDLRSVE